MVKLTRLKAIRERRALSQQELAQLAGLTRVTITRLESGVTQPYPKTTRKLAEVLGVNPEDIMGPDVKKGG